MKITDKLEVPVHDPVVKRGDILKVVDEDSADYYIVGKRAGNGNPNNVLINLATGGNWTSTEIPNSCRLSFYKNQIFTDFEAEVTHIPANKVELVIGG